MNQAVNLDSTWQEARIARGILSLIVTKELFQFEKDINTLIKLDPSNYHYYSIKAYLSVEQKKYRKAVINFRNAYNLEVDSLNKGNYKFSTKLERNKELQSALNYYHEKLGEIRPKTREYIDQGICQHILDNEQKAWRFYDSAYIEQDNSVTDFLKAVLYESDWNGSENAITFYTRALEKDSMIYSAYVNRAQIFAKNQNYQEAIVDCNKMIKLKPERKDGYKMKSTILMTTGRYIKAYQELTKAIFRDSSDMDLFFDRGMAALTTKYFKESRKDFEHVIKNNPQDGEAYYFLSINSLNMGDTLLAIKELDSASKFSRYKVNYHKELLALAKSQNLIDHQEIAYNRLVRYRSYNIDYRMNRAEFFYQQERYEEALKDFTFVVERRKKHRRATYYLGKTQIELGDIKSGEKLISKAKRLGFKE
jgi:tetratricopeptide (TPR) repeat protein